MSDSAVRRCSRLQHANKTPRTRQGLGGVMRIRVGLCLPVAVSPDGSRKGENRRTPLVLLTLASALATWNIKWRGSLVARFRLAEFVRILCGNWDFYVRPPSHLPRAWSPSFCFSRKVLGVFVTTKTRILFFYSSVSSTIFFNIREDRNRWSS